MGSLFVGSALLEQCNVNIVLGHRSREHMRSLISSLKGIINTFLNGQLVPQETEFLDFLSGFGFGLRPWIAFRQ